MKEKKPTFETWLKSQVNKAKRNEKKKQDELYPITHWFGEVMRYNLLKEVYDKYQLTKEN